MSRRFIAAILATATLVTGIGALPARASDAEDLRRFLGTAAGLVILGQVARALDDGEAAQLFTERGVRSLGSDERWRDGRGRWAVSRPVAKAPLPRRCVVRIHDRSSRYGLPARCLSAHYPQAHRLPERCAGRLHAAGFARPVGGYRLACLRGRGFEVAGR